jgi:hypothetical protein
MPNNTTKHSVMAIPRHRWRIVFSHFLRRQKTAKTEPLRLKKQYQFINTTHLRGNQ